MQTTTYNVSEIIGDLYQNQLNDDTTFLNFEQPSTSRYNVLSIENEDTMSYSAKVIVTKTGVYNLGCKCSASDYSYYHYVFETILNSFNPISGTRQVSIPQ